MEVEEEVHEFLNLTLHESDWSDFNYCFKHNVYCVTLVAPEIVWTLLLEWMYLNCCKDPNLT
jgi:hypothetical protein